MRLSIYFNVHLVSDSTGETLNAMLKATASQFAAAKPLEHIYALVRSRQQMQKTLAEIEDHFSKYRISDALMAIYKLVWDDFCSWLLEIVKPPYQQPIDKTTYGAVIQLFEQNLRLLHPFMPFLSEEVWQHIVERTPEQALNLEAK